MCDRIADLRRSLQRYGAGFEPTEIRLSAAKSVLEESVVIEKLAADLKARAANRIADLAPTSSDRRQVVRDLARLSGSGVRHAEEAIETQKRLAALPETAAAARRGELSAAQTKAVTAAASADPEAEAHLLEVARNRSLAELTDEAARVTAAADGDAEARRRRLHQRRSLRHWLDGEGSFRLDLRHTPEAGARLLSFLNPFIDEVRQAASDRGRHENADALAADGLMAMAEASIPAGAVPPQDAAPSDATPSEATPSTRSRRVPAKVIVRIDLGALLRGYPTGGEVCEITGVGPVAVSAVRDLMATEDPFLAAVVTDGEKLTGAVHLGRRPRALQVTALEWLYPACAVAGCNALAHLEFDHRVEWATSHVTVLDLIDRLCSRHHAFKTRKGWALIEGAGKREFVPPHDPRHPRHTRRPPPPRRRSSRLEQEAPPAA